MGMSPRPRTGARAGSRYMYRGLRHKHECTASIVGSPNLLQVRCRTVEELRSASALCGFVHMAYSNCAG